MFVWVGSEPAEELFSVLPLVPEFTGLEILFRSNPGISGKIFTTVVDFKTDRTLLNVFILLTISVNRHKIRI